MPEKAVKETPEMRELRAQLEEAQETLNAIRRGEVDGLVVSTPKGEQVYSISGAETPYRVLMEKMREGAITLSDDNTILYCNLGFAKMMKVPLEKIVGNNIENMISPTFKIAFKELLAKCRSGPKQEAETKGITFIADDKTLVPTQISVNSLNMDHTTTTFIVVTDLTHHMEEDLKRYTADLEKAGAALFESEQRWSTTLGSIGDAVIATDKAAKITYMNNMAEELTGWPLEKASGKPIQTVFKIISAATRKIVDDPVAKVLKKGQIVGLANHTTLIRQNGTEVPIDDSGAPIKDKEGKTTGVVLIFRDITERKRAEETLRYNELLLTGFFDSIGHMCGIVEVINDKDILHVKDNEVTASYVGLTPADLKGKLSSELGEPAERIKTWIEHYKQSQKTGKLVTWEYTDREGSKVTWLSPTVTYIGKSSEGNPRFTYVVTDITERKKAEEALSRINEELEERVQKRTQEVSSERQRLYNVLETLPAYVVLLDKDYRMPFANKVFRETFGESHGRRCHEYLFGRDSECENCETYKVLKTNKAQHWEWTGPNKHDYEIYDYPFIEADGSTLILEMGIDVTERKKAEKQIHDVSLYSRSLIEASLDPLVTINSQGKITDVNQATVLITGCSKAELIGSDFSDYFIEPEKAKMGYKRVFAEGVVKDYPLAIKHKNGRISEVLYNATVYRNNAGEIQGVFAAARDITEQKKAEAEAQEAAKKLKDAERLAAIGATAGMVGHDIRNPLQAIAGDVYLLREELRGMPEREEKNNAEESLLGIEKNVDYINKIVADLQDFARPLKPNAEETDIKLVIDELLKKNGLPENVRVSVNVESDATIVVADSTFINRIMYNLVTNAVQAMPNGGKLTIRTYKEANEIVISVKDTGVGIPEVVKSKLFTPMFTTKSKGQGFGLAVIKRMTEALGGTVTFDSQEGKGTTFTVRLPFTKKPAKN